jgi:hypothetical protein
MKGKFTDLASVYVTPSFTLLFQNSRIPYKNQTKSLDFKINDAVCYTHSPNVEYITNAVEEKFIKLLAWFQASAAK